MNDKKNKETVYANSAYYYVLTCPPAATLLQKVIIYYYMNSCNDPINHCKFGLMK